MGTKAVNIYYGPVVSCNLTLEHKPQLVHGLRDKLLKLGLRVDLKPTEFINLCLIEIDGVEVFKCDLKNLGFNISYQKSNLCKVTVNTVQQSVKMLEASSLKLWCRNLVEGLLFKHESAPSYFVSKRTALKELGNPLECQRCCQILCSSKERAPRDDTELPIKLSINRLEQKILDQYPQGLEVLCEERD